MSASACVIPALDASQTLAGVVRGIRQALGDVYVVVIDDGSHDQTAAVARSCADHVVRFAGNRGKGAALRAGMRVATALGSPTVLTVDADGQHDPRCAPALLAALDRADLVVGVRARRGSPMPWHRRVSNAVSAAAVSMCAGCDIRGQPIGLPRVSPRASRGARAARRSLRVRDGSLDSGSTRGVAHRLGAHPHDLWGTKPFPTAAGQHAHRTDDGAAGIGASVNPVEQ